MPSPKKIRLLLLAPLIALLLLNFPWLALFSQEGLIAGVPILYLYLFIIWGLLILVVGLFLDTRDNTDKQRNNGSRVRPGEGGSDDAAAS